MTVRVEGQTIHLEGRCRLEEAEQLLALFVQNPDHRVAIGASTSLHTAIVQILLAAKPMVLGRPANSFLSRFLSPVLENESSASSQRSLRL